MSTTAVGRVLERHELAEVLDQIRPTGARIVFTNGCFDLLHLGHASYLARARALGDLLVVGVNSDASVRRLKGPGRPLVPERERAGLVAHLGSVDLVTIFEEDRPDALIEIVRPGIHVKGGDYTIETLPEAEVVHRHGGEVVILSLVDGLSTTRLVERARTSPAGPEDSTE